MCNIRIEAIKGVTYNYKSIIVLKKIAWKSFWYRDISIKYHRFKRSVRRMSRTYENTRTKVPEISGNFL